MESTCKQYQVRFHRSGQFWTTQGDEALMCLETFWRNGRWSLLFPHVPADLTPPKIEMLTSAVYRNKHIAPGLEDGYTEAMRTVYPR